MKTIFDRAREFVAQSPRPMTLSDAMAKLGRRGGKHHSRKTLTAPKPKAAYWWQEN